MKKGQFQPILSTVHYGYMPKLRPAKTSDRQNLVGDKTGVYLVEKSAQSTLDYKIF